MRDGVAGEEGGAREPWSNSSMFVELELLPLFRSVELGPLRPEGHGCLPLKREES